MDIKRQNKRPRNRQTLHLQNRPIRLSSMLRSNTQINTDRGITMKLEFDIHIKLTNEQFEALIKLVTETIEKNVKLMKPSIEKLVQEEVKAQLKGV